MAEVNPALEGATSEETSSEELGQVTEPTLTDVLARMEKMERGWEERFDRVFNGMQATTQREVGRVATQIVALEGQIGELTTKAEITRRVLEQGYDSETVQAVQNAVAQERKVQELEAREKVLKNIPAPSLDHNRIWAAADQRLLEHAHREGMLSSADYHDLVDAQGNPLEGHEDEVAWYRSMIPVSNEPLSLELLERIEREARRRITTEAEKKAKTMSKTLPNTGRPLATRTLSFANTPIAEIKEDDWVKHREQIVREKLLANRR